MKSMERLAIFAKEYEECVTYNEQLIWLIFNKDKVELVDNNNGDYIVVRKEKK